MFHNSCDLSHLADVARIVCFNHLVALTVHLLHNCRLHSHWNCDFLIG